MPSENEKEKKKSSLISLFKTAPSHHSLWPDSALLFLYNTHHHQTLNHFNSIFYCFYPPPGHNLLESMKLSQFFPLIHSV